MGNNEDDPDEGPRDLSEIAIKYGKLLYLINIYYCHINIIYCCHIEWMKALNINFIFINI